MKIITLKLNNDKSTRYDLIRFCEEYKCSTYITWQTEDILDNQILVDLLVPKDVVSKVHDKYGSKIKSQETL